MALAVSGVLSYFLLARQRAALALLVEDAVGRGRKRLADRTAREDAYAEAVQTGEVEPPDRTAARGVTRADR